MNSPEKLLVLLALVIGTTALYGQHPVNPQIKTLKVGFITEQLRLTPKEAETFWPLYNQYEEQRDGLRKKEHLELSAQSKRAENMSPAAASALLEAFLELQKEKYKVEKDFILDISNVISPQKTLLLLAAEKAFKKELLEQYHKRGKIH